MSSEAMELGRGWATAVRQRRKALLQRLGMGAATAMVFSPLFGWAFSATWVAAYFAIQLIDLWVFGPINSGRTERMGPARSAVGGAILFLNALSFGSMSVPLWLKGGEMGGICAAILLCSGAVYAVVNSPRSGRVFVLTISAQLMYMAMIPLFMVSNGADAAFIAAVCIALVVFGGFCVSTWQRIDRAYMSELTARAEAQSRQAEAERIMAGRTAFLAAVGHDLRTPIGAILTGAAEIDAGAGDSVTRAQAALITDAGLMMKALLDDLLDHAKLDAGRMSVEVEDFDLRQMLAQTLRLWQGPVSAKDLSLRVEGARSMPAMVRGDAMRLRQVLNNLISNAIKFTNEGSITLRLSGWTEEPAGHAVVIEVVDTGPGMTRQQLARLFTPFDQTAEGVSARHGGTGLGLAISRDLAGLMGGRLTARSAPGEGAAFTLSLILGASQSERPAPRALQPEARGDIARALNARLSAPKPTAAPIVEAPTVEVAAVTPPEMTTPVESLARQTHEPATTEPVPVEVDAEGEDRPLRVLVVDDHDINRRAVELILTPLGCDISTAADGMAALVQCEAAAFDVIFMDVRMPELDGRETTRRLRAGNGVNAATPVIAVTADTQPDDIAACMDAGMDYFVSKPLTPAALLNALGQVLAGEDEDQDQVAAA